MMKKINLSDLKAGMKFSRAVYITPTNMLVGPNMPLKSSDIEKLKRWGIKEVETAGDIIFSPTPEILEDEKPKPGDYKKRIVLEYNKLHRIKKRYKDEYDEAVNGISSILRYAQHKKAINEVKIRNIAHTLVSSILPNEHIFIYLASNMTNENDYLPYHSINVAIFSVIIANQIKIDPKLMANLTISAILHDIGMTKIPLKILTKKERLTTEEFNIIKLHPIYGYKMLAKDSSLSADIANVALQHHEQYDGEGYPRKLKGEKIDLFSRIVAIADTYDAMTKKRNYRAKFISYDAMKNILSESKNKFDPRLLKIFLSNLSIYPVASLVKLNTNAVGMVIGAYSDKPLRPIIKIIVDEFGDRLEETEERIIDLSEEQDMFIVGAVNEKDFGINTFSLV
ncbi:MAG: HD domain-containing protein [Spirochaetes bacterium]|nr:HD domain-containing protein [Spirochaetota bacterium]